MSDRDELRAEIERCLDGDLSRAEGRALLERLAASPEARAILAETLGLERQLGALAETYEQVEPSPAFVNAGLAGPAHAPLSQRIGRAWDELTRGWRRSWSRQLWPGLVGAAVATLVLVYVVIPGRDMRMAERLAEQVGERLHVLDVPFQTVADNDVWTHTAHIEPGQAVRFQVETSHERDFHLRIIGGGDVDVMLIHSRPDMPDQTHRIKGGSIHYAALPRPRKGDVLVVRNDGKTAVDFHVAAASRNDVSIHPVLPEKSETKTIAH